MFTRAYAREGVKMIERDVEKYLCKQIKNEMGGVALKWVCPGLNGVPDRIVLLPHARIYFVELKAPGLKLRKLQRYVRDKIRGYGFEVLRLDSKEAIDDFIRQVRGYEV